MKNLQEDKTLASNLGGQEKATPNKEKHIVLDDAIQEIDGVNSRLDALLARINGNDREPPTLTTARSIPPLSCLLIEGAETIKYKLSEIHGLIDQLEDNLF